MDNLLTRVGSKYYYRPKETISFKPQTFNYVATIKKQLDYRISNEYNLNIACIDDPDSLDLSDRIAVGFSSPNERNLIPPNITINNNRKDVQSFTDMTNRECDFLFIESSEGLYYDDVTDDRVKIDKDMFLDKNTSIWITADYNRTYPHVSTESKEFYTIKQPVLNSKVEIGSRYYFDIDTLPYDNSSIKYHNIFAGHRAPVLIIEHLGKGFEIISHSDVLNNMQEYLQLIYEVLMYCYLKGYKSTATLNQWISNEVPDYQVESGSLVKKKYFTSDMNMASYFSLKNSEMILYSVNITHDQDNNNMPEIYDPAIDLFDYTTAINFVGMSNGKLMFEKNMPRSSPYNTEPDKPLGWISVYDGENILYLKELHYVVETNLTDKIFTSIHDDSLEIKVLAFKSTSLCLDTQKPFDAIIPFIKTEVNKIERIREADYTFYINKENQNIDFTFSEDFEEKLGIALFDIKVYQTPDAVNITDMRQLGGGLKEDCEDNYNLMDIGHINGRPYRPTGTIVLTLPKKLEEHNDIIEKAIKKYIGASEVPVIFYEDKKQ